MKTRLILKPGQRGTKRLTEQYGDALVCVRFRYDAVSRQRLKTVELIVERTDWTPPTPRYPLDALVPLHIEAVDIRKRSMAKTAGGKWDHEKRLWFVRYGNIVGTPLEKHIQVDARHSGATREKHLPVYAKTVSTDISLRLQVYAYIYL